MQDTPGKLTINVSYWDTDYSQNNEISVISKKIIEDFSSMADLDIVIPQVPNWIQSREGKFATCIQKIKN